MTAARLSRETTSKLLGTMAPAHSSPPRRITRAALARFAYNNASSSSSSATIATPPDIEDAVPSTTLTRKRKRVAIHAASASSSSTTVAKTETIKKEKKEDEEEDDDVKDQVKDEEEEEEEESKATAAPRRARKPARRVVDPDTAEATTEPPSDWEEMYAAVKAMRFGPGGAAANAAVDTMGCERLAEPHASPRDRRFQTLVALMLSSQTKDTTNAVAMRRLQTELDAADPGGGGAPGLTLENVLAVAPERLNELIWLVGFHNNKTRYLKQTAEILRDRWDGDIPDTFAGLTSLPGVGPKMAHLCLSAAWGRTEGIGVDVHVHRITNLWGWHTTRNPEDTRRALEAWLPRDRWHEINTLLVGLGQTVCLPVGRRCGDCDLGLRGLCKAADRAKVNQGRRAKKEEEEDARVKVEVKAEVEIGELEDEVGEPSTVVKKEEHSEDKEQVAAKKEEDERQKEETHEIIKKEESVAVTVIKNESVAVEDVLKNESVAVEDVLKNESVAVEDVVKDESAAVEGVVKREDVTTDEEKTVIKGEVASDDEVKQELETGRRVRRRRR